MILHTIYNTYDIRGLSVELWLWVSLFPGVPVLWVFCVLLDKHNCSRTAKSNKSEKTEPFRCELWPASLKINIVLCVM